MKLLLKILPVVIVVVVAIVAVTRDEEMIVITKPQPYDVISSPLEIKGEARGAWFFEASFPIELLDANGDIVGTAIAQAQGDWMTEKFVPFKASIEFEATPVDKGTLVFKKDNPSGLAKYDDELRVPIIFGAMRLEEQKKSVRLYYYNQEKDMDENGNALCSRQGLEAVEREIQITQTPIQDTIKLLLKGGLTQTELESGISTEYPLSGFKLKSTSLNDGVLTLEFNDPENKTGGGSCRVGILWFQIEETAKQFPEVNSVKFIPEELFQP